MDAVHVTPWQSDIAVHVTSHSVSLILQTRRDFCPLSVFVRGVAVVSAHGMGTNLQNGKQVADIPKCFHQSAHILHCAGDLTALNHALDPCIMNLKLHELQFVCRLHNHVFAGSSNDIVRHHILR